MKRSTKKGFTIVELVIVIAVIAILAAVLIPTFSSLIKKANLSADMQAVRTINLALQTAEAKNGKPANVDQAMLIIEEAGYDVATYKPLTKGYDIYWVDTVNRVILYSTAEGKEGVVYPEDYVDLINDNSWHYLNESYKNAVKYDFSNIVSGDGKTYDMSELNAEKAGEALYAAFVRMTETDLDNTIANDVEIKLPAEVNVSNYIWKPVKNFAGKLIGTSAENPTVISGVTLDESVSFSQSEQFAGGVQNDKGNSVYNVYGFINKVSGTAEIKDITFEGFTLTSPGTDFASAGVSTNANVLAPIGCVLLEDESSTIKISNVNVKDGTIKGIGRVSGLVGYIGSPYKGGEYNGGTVTIENCHVEDVTIKGGLVSKNYGSAGGLVGYIVRANELTVNITNCSVKDCTIEGTAMVAGAVGYFAPEPNKKDNPCVINLNVNGLTMSGNTIKTTAEHAGGLNFLAGNIHAGLVVSGNTTYKTYVDIQNLVIGENPNTVTVPTGLNATADPDGKFGK